MKNQISITIFKDFFFYLFQCLTLKSNTAWWKWNVFKFLLCLRIERTYVISSLIKRISGILFPWNKTSLNSIRATHNRGNILFEIRSIFGRCIFLVSVVSQLPLNSSAHTAAAYVWGPGPPQGARGHLQPWPHSGSLALRRHAVPTVHLKEVGPVAPLPKRAHTFSSWSVWLCLKTFAVLQTSLRRCCPY